MTSSESTANSEPHSAELELLALLRYRWQQLEKRRGKFSLRSYARLLGIPAPVVSEVLRGKRRITPPLGRRLCGALDLAEDITERIVAAIPEKTAPRASVDTVFLDKEFSLLADWYYFAIMSMTHTVGFKNDPQWIARRIGITFTQARIAVDRLVELGFCRIQGRRLVATNLRMSNRADVPNLAAREFSRQGLVHAAKALEEVPVLEREFFNFFIPGDPALLPKAKTRLRKVAREIGALMGKKKKRCSTVYRIAVQLYPITR